MLEMKAKELFLLFDFEFLDEIGWQYCTLFLFFVYHAMWMLREIGSGFGHGAAFRFGMMMPLRGGVVLCRIKCMHDVRYPIHSPILPGFAFEDGCL